MSKNRASVAACIGMTGTGKSAGIKAGMRRAMPARLLAWDPQGEYAEFGTVYRDRRALLDAVRGARTFAAIYQPGDDARAYADRFDWLCRLAYALGRVRYLVEELADVTTASHAPASWSIVCRKGRHKGLEVVATSQRPADVDKSFFGNCTHVRCGRLILRPELATMAGVLEVSAEDIKALPDLHFFERDMRTGATRRGVVDLPAGARHGRT